MLYGYEVISDDVVMGCVNVSVCNEYMAISESKLIICYVYVLV